MNTVTFSKLNRDISGKYYTVIVNDKPTCEISGPDWNSRFKYTFQGYLFNTLKEAKEYVKGYYAYSEKN